MDTTTNYTGAMFIIVAVVVIVATISFQLPDYFTSSSREASDSQRLDKKFNKTNYPQNLAMDYLPLTR
ncbi:9747_t:CDS:1, partial [Funneliformis geosporum]